MKLEPEPDRSPHSRPTLALTLTFTLSPTKASKKYAALKEQYVALRPGCGQGSSIREVSRRAPPVPVAVGCDRGGEGGVNGVESLTVAGSCADATAAATASMAAGTGAGAGAVGSGAGAGTAAVAAAASAEEEAEWQIATEARLVYMRRLVEQSSSLETSGE